MNFKRNLAAIILTLSFVTGCYLQAQETQASLWAIKDNGRVCFREGIDANNPMGKTWKETEGFGQEIVVNKFGHAWIIDPTNSNIQVRTGVTLTNPAGTEWTPVDGKALHLALYEDDILAIQASGVYKRVGITPTNPEGTAWQQVIATKNIRKLAGNTEVQLPVGLTETIVAVDAKGAVYLQSGITEDNLQGGIFIPAKEKHFLNEISGKLISLAVNDYGTLWAINEAGQINYKKDLHTDWQPVKGALKQLDIDNKGNVWGISEMGINAPGGLNYHPADVNGWQPLGDGFAQVAVNKVTGHAIAIKLDGTITYWPEPATTSMIELPSPGRNGKKVALTMAAINKDNFIWVLDTANDIWFTTLNLHKPTATTWLQIPGKLKYITITNRGQVRGIDPANNLYFRTKIDPLNIHGIDWAELKTPAGVSFELLLSSGIELDEIKQDPTTTKAAIQKRKGPGRPKKKLEKKVQAKKAAKVKSKPVAKKATKAKKSKPVAKKPIKKQKQAKATPKKQQPKTTTPQAIKDKATESKTLTPPVIEIEKVATSDVSRELSLPQERVTS